MKAYEQDISEYQPWPDEVPDSELFTQAKMIAEDEWNRIERRRKNKEDKTHD